MSREHHSGHQCGEDCTTCENAATDTEIAREFGDTWDEEPGGEW